METPAELIEDSARPQEAVTDTIALMDSIGAFRSTGSIEHEIRNILSELNDEPLRVAVVGKTKAGKSTLINSLVGAGVAPTDTLSCTKFVAWYRAAKFDWAQARLRDGRQPVQVVWPLRSEAPIADGVADSNIDDIHVWRKGLPRLSEWTIIDTPGYNESEPEVRQRTRRVFAVECIDAVLFVLNGAAAAEELRFFADVRADLAAVLAHEGDEDGRASSAFGLVNTLAVLTRIDMFDGQDPFGGAEKVIDQHADELRAIATTVVPVLGIFAETANQLTDDDYARLADLTTLTDTQLLAGLFRNAAQRVGLADDDIVRLGTLFKPYGLRFAVGAVRTGAVQSRAELAQAMLTHSQLTVLENAIRERFTARTAALKARTAVRRLTQLSREHDALAVMRPYLKRILRLDSMHTLQEYEAYERWRSGDVVLPTYIGEPLTALVFGQGCAARAGAAPDATPVQIRSALWERVGECDEFLAESWSAAATDIAHVMRRSYSLLLGELEGSGVT